MSNFVTRVLFSLNFITLVAIVPLFFRPPEHVPLHSQWLGQIYRLLKTSEGLQKEPPTPCQHSVLAQPYPASLTVPDT